MLHVCCVLCCRMFICAGALLLFVFFLASSLLYLRSPPWGRVPARLLFVPTGGSSLRSQAEPLEVV